MLFYSFFLHGHFDGGWEVGWGGGGVWGCNGACYVPPPSILRTVPFPVGSAWVRKGLPIEDWIIYRGPGFLTVVCFGSSPPPLSPSLFSKLTGNTQEDLERETTCWGERGKGGGRGAESYVWPQESMVLYKSFNTLWGYPSYPKLSMFILPAVVYNIIIC